MQIKVLYFATYRARTDIREEQIQVPEGASIADLKRILEQRHASLTGALSTALFAINREFAFPEDLLHAEDEVAIFPPVSGGSLPTIIRITDDPLDINTLLEQIVTETTGATCAFTGMVRGKTMRGETHATAFLEYEAFKPMAEAKLQQVSEEIRAHWPTVEGVAIVQRVGRMDPGTPTVLVACSAPHRDTGVFEAARYGIDRLKEIVPVWKKEIAPDGEHWVEGRYRPRKEDRSG